MRISYASRGRCVEHMLWFVFFCPIEINFSGNYQIKQANTYRYEHLRPSYFDEDDLEFIVELCDK